MSIFAVSYILENKTKHLVRSEIQREFKGLNLDLLESAIVTEVMIEEPLVKIVKVVDSNVSN